ncbi:GCSs-MCP-PilZ domain protein [Candidatus Bealeia paramacronuclearis]|uniref:GCSs-MCP-PilZ domain protein n=1 Tax=Candidatus Bealeia paramacronuclearis TaxID=1921001 RepID=A0ABZ2C1Z0_9PROT|nr:GCSs-MCP-PilZ domain protein [Candidatus Bealeia paramacronuclearis]
MSEINGVSYRDRINFFLITQEDSRNLQEFWKVLEPKLQGILSAFYDHMLSWPTTKDIIGNPSNVDRLKKAQHSHWRTLFDGKFDDKFFDEGQRIGTAHDKIGLTPVWYIGGYVFILTKINDIAIEFYKKDQKKLAGILSATQKAILLDMEVAISVFLRKGQDAQLQKEMLQLANALDTEIQTSVLGVTKRAIELNSIAKSMSVSAEKVSSRTNVVTQAAEGTTQNVQTVASATEELAASSQEIGSQMGQASLVAKNAVNDAENAGVTINSLSHAAEKISEVVDLINTIARQTNLLALNATIEAARAGEAGRGFAVVANEVKNLASQTASATDDVAQQARNIQNATREAVSAIERINGTITEISSISTTIAAAVEEQSAATAEISRNAQEAASNTIEVSSNMEGVSSESSETGRLANSVEQLSSGLITEMEELKERLTKLLRNSQAGERRESPRKSLNIKATAKVGSENLSGTIIDISEGGAGVSLEAGAHGGVVGGTVSILARGSSISCQIVSVEGSILHLKFIENAQGFLRGLNAQAA